MKMNSFESLAQKCWEATTIEGKRAALIEMVDNFYFKAKSQEFLDKIANATKMSDLDRLAGNLALNNTNKVIR